MSAQLEDDSPEAFDSDSFQHHLPQYYRAFLKNFRKISSSFVSFNILFLALASLQVFSIFFFFPFLSSRSLFFAFALGAFLLTCFTYFVLLFYFQAKKPDQLLSLKEQFLTSCQQILHPSSGESHHHLSLANALSKLSLYLQDFESNFYKIPSFLQPLSRGINQFSAYCYGEDVFRMKELLFQTAIDEHLKQIKNTPTDLEVHASLANAYISLSRVYKDFLKSPKADRYEKLKALFEQKFLASAELAIEEFKILNHYAPNDPWVHEQLSSGYRELEMPEEEIREVEFLTKLRPQDQEILFRLGNLYFQQGQNAKGLEIYEELKSSYYKKAEDLISNYGKFSLEDF